MTNMKKIRQEHELSESIENWGWNFALLPVKPNVTQRKLLPIKRHTTNN